MVSKFSVEQRLAILREYDAGGISLIELGAKYAVDESTLSGWRWRHLSPCERKCTVCGSTVPRKAVTWRGSLLCGTSVNFRCEKRLRPLDSVDAVLSIR
jgi:hypothetical protein